MQTETDHEEPTQVGRWRALVREQLVAGVDFSTAADFAARRFPSVRAAIRRRIEPPRTTSRNHDR